jgi:hypothetical protein
MYVPTYMQMHVCTYIQMHVCMYIHVFKCIHTYTQITGKPNNLEICGTESQTLGPST